MQEAVAEGSRQSQDKDAGAADNAALFSGQTGEFANHGENIFADTQDS